jgi:2-haloacid dehalogenase
MNEPKNSSGIKACVFDAYGTLFDVHSAVAKHRRRLGKRGNDVSAMWRTKQLEYTWLRSLMGSYADFWQVTSDALEYALDSTDIEDPMLHDDLMQAYLNLTAYEEVSAVLQRLKSAGFFTAILSNGEPGMLSSAVQGAGIDNLLDKCLSVHELQVYKPDPRVYQLVTDAFRVAPAEVIFLSSNAWDAAGAAHFGFNVLWVNRFDQRPERLPARPAYESRDLKRLLQILNLDS